MSPAALAHLFQWSVPFGLNIPGDVSKDLEVPPWHQRLSFPVTRGGGARLPLRRTGVLHVLHADLFSKIRVLAEAYFRLSATVLQPLVDQLGNQPLEEQAKAALRGYIDQVRTLPAAWGHIEI
jgi:hypothetical protein